MSSRLSRYYTYRVIKDGVLKTNNSKRTTKRKCVKDSEYPSKKEDNTIEICLNCDYPICRGYCDKIKEIKNG